jgi:hypothetical protein
MAWFCLLKIVIDKFIARWGGFLAHLHSPWGYDEPEILRYSNRHFGPIGADAGHYGFQRRQQCLHHLSVCQWAS